METTVAANIRDRNAAKLSQNTSHCADITEAARTLVLMHIKNIESVVKGIHREAWAQLREM